MTFCSDELALRLTETHPASEDLPPWQYFDIIENATGEVAGKISARLGDNAHTYYNGHMGFEIDPAKRGHGYAAKAAQLLLPLFPQHNLGRIYLTCAESNMPSRKSIERLGAMLLEIIEVPVWCFFWRDGMERYCIYELRLARRGIHAEPVVWRIWFAKSTSCRLGAVPEHIFALAGLTYDLW